MALGQLNAENVRIAASSKALLRCVVHKRQMRLENAKSASDSC